jgi:predicted Rossmann fold nucleotide-binding protein DprA/Smf involved in DNA uptake
MPELSPNTKAILLLTAPLIIGRERGGIAPLTPAQYRNLSWHLRERRRQPADLIDPESDGTLEVAAQALAPKVDEARLRALLGRGFQLTQAIERWQARAIWVVSRADAHYPRRLKARLKDAAPAILYGCGDNALLDSGGLAVVGSRHVDETLLHYTESIGRLAAEAGRSIISGAARGIDQAAMNGALLSGGRCIGVVAADLERAAVQREHRDLILDQRLVLISPYDPAAGFNVGNAMQRNKLIYALADAALVVNTDYQKGGTWAGAVEQLDKLHCVPLYTRSAENGSEGLKALRQKGALRWPEPSTSDALQALLDRPPESAPLGSTSPPPERTNVSAPHTEVAPSQPGLEGDSCAEAAPASEQAPADELFSTVRRLIVSLSAPKTENEIAEELQVSRAQAKQWLSRLVDEGVIEKTARPVRYRPAPSRPVQSSLFG